MVLLPDIRYYFLCPGAQPRAFPVGKFTGGSRWSEVSQLISGLVACFRELLPGTLLSLRDMSGTSLEESARFGALAPNQSHFFLLF